MDGDLKTKPIKSNLFSWLPDEILVDQLLAVDDLSDLLNLCSTDKRIYGICQDEVFWKTKYQRDIGFISTDSNLTWKERYKRDYLFLIPNPISAGDGHFMVIDENGDLNLIKKNRPGQLEQSPKITSDSKIVSVSIIGNSSCFVTDNGKAYSFRIDHSPNSEELFVPIINDQQMKAIKISGYLEHFLLILDNRQVYYDIYNSKGIIDLQATDILVKSDKFFISTLDGNLHIWNIGPRGYFRKRQEITISEPIKQIVSFTANIAILTTTGNVYSWVYDYYSNKYERAIINLSGHGETGKIFQSPKKIEGLDNIVQISMGNIFNMLAVDSSGDLYLWGKIIPGIADNYKERNKLRRVIYEAKKLFILAGNTSGRASYLDLTKALQINKEDDNVNDEDDNNFSSSSPLKIRFNPDIRVRSAVMSGGKILILGKDGQLYTW